MLRHINSLNLFNFPAIHWASVYYNGKVKKCVPSDFFLARQAFREVKVQFGQRRPSCTSDLVPLHMRWSPLSKTSWLSFLNSTMCAKTYSSTCFASWALFGSLFATPRMSALSLRQKSHSRS